MARVRVNYHTEIAGKFDAHFGHRQELVNETDVAGTDGFNRPSAAACITTLTNNNKHNPKTGAVIVIDNMAYLDEKALTILS